MAVKQRVQSKKRCKHETNPHPLLAMPKEQNKKVRIETQKTTKKGKRVPDRIRLYILVLMLLLLLLLLFSH